MKWVFAFSGGSDAAYGDLIRVSVQSALANTSLHAVCLVDGPESALTAWLRARGVTLIACRSRFLPELEDLARFLRDEGYGRIGAGTFLRLELPRVAREQGWSDEWVLYTGCDVMFSRDPASQLQQLKPRFFAAAPETFQKRSNINRCI